MYHDRAARRCAFFVGKKKMEAKDIHKEMLPMYGEHCLLRQAVRNWVQKLSEGADKYRRRTSSRSAGGDRHAGNVAPRRRQGTCETVGQVFKFVWRLC